MCTDFSRLFSKNVWKLISLYVRIFYCRGLFSVNKNALFSYFCLNWRCSWRWILWRWEEAIHKVSSHAAAAVFDRSYISECETSYHTDSHQILSMNVSCINWRARPSLKLYECPPPLYNAHRTKDKGACYLMIFSKVLNVISLSKIRTYLYLKWFTDFEEKNNCVVYPDTFLLCTLSNYLLNI